MNRMDNAYIVVHLWPDDLKGCFSISSARMVIRRQADRLREDLKALTQARDAGIDGFDEIIEDLEARLDLCRQALKKLDRV